MQFLKKVEKGESKFEHLKIKHFGCRNQINFKLMYLNEKIKQYGFHDDYLRHLKVTNT